MAVADIKRCMFIHQVFEACLLGRIFALQNCFCGSTNCNDGSTLPQSIMCFLSLFGECMHMGVAA